MLPTSSCSGRPGEAVDQGQQTAGDGDRPGDVVAGVAVGLALVDDRHRHDRRHDGDGHVDQQAPPPRGVLGEHPTHDESDGGTATGDPAVDTEGGRSFLHLGEGHCDQRQGGRGQQGGEGPLQGTGSKEHWGVDRGTSEGRSAAKPSRPTMKMRLRPT